MPNATYFVQECPTCGRRLQIRVEYLGKRVVCQHCQGKFVAMDPCGVQGGLCRSRQCFAAPGRRIAEVGRRSGIWPRVSGLATVAGGKITRLISPSARPDPQKNPDTSSPCSRGSSDDHARRGQPHQGQTHRQAVVVVGVQGRPVQLAGNDSQAVVIFLHRGAQLRSSVASARMRSALLAANMGHATDRRWAIGKQRHRGKRGHGVAYGFISVSMPCKGPPTSVIRSACAMDLASHLLETIAECHVALKALSR